jgi:L-cystine uptake protein TcyP (sodium:dicarboxylate symporter family)
MLITILVVIATCITGVVAKKANHIDIYGASILAHIVLCMVTLCCVACCVTIQINEDIEYQNAYYHKATLEYRLENIEKNNVGNEHLYNDIVEFNNSLRFTKKWANNPWTNWFNNQRISELDYIEIPVS